MSRLALVLLASAYALSFCLPVMPGLRTTIYGWQAFLFVTYVPDVLARDGWIVGLSLCMLWLPNLIFWVGLAFVAKESGRGAMVAGFSALLLALSAGVFIADWAVFRSGYYTWLGVMFAMMGYGFYLEMGKPITPPHQTTAASDPLDRRCSSP